MVVSWEVEYTGEFEAWWHELSEEDQERIDALVEILEERGPGTGRPAVDTVKGSRHPNMKELRPGTVRVLFTFDPRRAAILLIGGDKRDRWDDWYQQMIPVADELFDAHLEELTKEGLI